MLHCPRNIMRKVIFTGIFLATGLASALAADPTGDWRVADGVANIRVAECNGSMWGVVVVGEDAGRARHEQSGCLKKEQADAGHADPDRHEEEGRASINGKAKSITPRTDNSTVRRSSPSDPTSLKFKAACWAFSAAGKPGPASQVQFPQARQTAWPRARRRLKARRRPRDPLTRPRKRPVKSRRRRAAADPVGDICLLPDIARFAH